MRGISNFIVINKDKTISIRKHVTVIDCSIFTETGLPFIFSIIKNISLPPSKAGIGNKLNMATKTAMMPMK
jgi:hypothetical protein